jgi:mono/diheme cytochrome c family protein
MRAHELNHDPVLAWLIPVALAGLLSACGGGDKVPADGTGAPAAGDAPATPPPAADTPATPPPATDTPDTPPASTDRQVTPPAATDTRATGDAQASIQLIALGDSIFHGQVGGGTCFACHGQDAKGSSVGPNLTDSEWLNTDGSLEGIIKTIQSGVPKPKKAPAPMPPMGGASLTPEQVRAVAAYEYSLSHGGGQS